MRRLNAGPSRHGMPAAGSTPRPLDGRRQRRRDVQVERLPVDLVDVQRPVVAGARARVDQLLHLAARLHGLVAVQRRPRPWRGPRASVPGIQYFRMLSSPAWACQ